MTMIAVWRIDGERVAHGVEEFRHKLDSAGGEVVLDFSSVSRIDAAAIRALENLAVEAGEKSIKLALRGVSVEIYRVLKLVKLAPRYSFAG